MPKKQDSMMKFSPDDGSKQPYPSHAEQWRNMYSKKPWVFDPWTGMRRDPRAIHDDPMGLLIAPHEVLQINVTAEFFPDIINTIVTAFKDGMATVGVDLAGKNDEQHIVIKLDGSAIGTCVTKSLARQERMQCDECVSLYVAARKTTSKKNALPPCFGDRGTCCE